MALKATLPELFFCILLESVASLAFEFRKQVQNLIHGA